MIRLQSQKESAHPHDLRYARRQYLYLEMLAREARLAVPDRLRSQPVPLSQSTPSQWRAEYSVPGPSPHLSEWRSHQSRCKKAQRLKCRAKDRCEKMCSDHKTDSYRKMMAAMADRSDNVLWRSQPE